MKWNERVTMFCYEVNRRKMYETLKGMTRTRKVTNDTVTASHNHTNYYNSYYLFYASPNKKIMIFYIIIWRYCDLGCVDINKICGYIKDLWIFWDTKI